MAALQLDKAIHHWLDKVIHHWVDKVIHHWMDKVIQHWMDKAIQHCKSLIIAKILIISRERLIQGCFAIQLTSKQPCAFDENSL